MAETNYLTNWEYVCSVICQAVALAPYLNQSLSSVTYNVLPGSWFNGSTMLSLRILAQCLDIQFYMKNEDFSDNDNDGADNELDEDNSEAMGKSFIIY